VLLPISQVHGQLNMACEEAEVHLLGLGVRLGLYLQGISYAVVVFRGVLWRSRSLADITLLSFTALVRCALSALYPSWRVQPFSCNLLGMQIVLLC
jgi:hypothetical protein